jgi:hypothetical protein
MWIAIFRILEWSAVYLYKAKIAICEEIRVTPGQLVEAISIALDASEETVVQHDRNLAVAGLRTTGARGRNAPHVTHLDAARVIVAALGSVRTKDSVETIKKLENTASRDGGIVNAVPALAGLALDHNFIDALAALIEYTSTLLSSSDEPPPILAGMRSSSISCNMPFGSGQFILPANEKIKAFRYSARKKERFPMRGIHQYRSMFGEAVLLMGLAFRDNGLRDYRRATKILDAIVPRPSMGAESENNEVA